MNKVKVFFFANIPVPGENLSYGGATILAENILKYLKLKPQVYIYQKAIRKTWIPKLHLFDHLLWLIRFPFVIRKFDVISFHGTWDFNFTVAPFLWIWAKILNKKIIYHFIGGDFIDRYKKSPNFIKMFFRHTLFKSNTVFFETMEQINFFSNNKIKNCIWLPNARPPVEGVESSELFEKKFVYLSRIIPEKGINEIIDVSLRLDDTYKIDIIGPLNERYYTQDQLSKGKASFIDTLVNPEDLKFVLSKYDVLLLPTYFEGEGYPGIVIDCLALGIPVITTRWKALPEMINHKVNGYLIDIKNVDQLEEAILHFNNENYSYYRKNALKSFETFDSDKVFKKVIDSYL